ncbi:MAG: zf-HC2 domain-containing protein, partial [Planctomycetota bacterium]
MECKEILESLSLFVLGDLPSEREGVVREHLAACPDCRKEEDRIRKTAEALRGIPEIPPQAARRKRLIAAAASEGLLPSGRRFPRFLPPLGVLGAAAAVLLLVSFLAGWWPEGPERGPGSHEKIHGPKEENLVLKPVAEVAKVLGQVGLVRKGKFPRPPRRLESLFIGDRLFVEGNGNEVQIRFHEDAMQLTLFGERLGGSEIVLEGVSEKKYRIHLERGSIRGNFLSGPLEVQESRKEGDRVIPLAVTSPIAQVEIHAGQEFEIRQEKVVGLMKNMLEVKKRKEGGDVFSMRFEDFEISRFFTQHLPKIMEVGQEVGLEQFQGKTVTILCNSITREEFPDLFNSALGPIGLEIYGRDNRHFLRARPGGAVAAPPAWENPAYGEFTVMLVTGKAKISSRNPNIHGGVWVHGGQMGRVRPGTKPEDALAEPPMLVEAQQIKIELA